MGTKAKRKLTLRRETLRALDASVLARVAGGGAGEPGDEGGGGGDVSGTNCSTPEATCVDIYGRLGGGGSVGCRYP